ncbi:MAG: cell wall hydrolase, partial [Caulobacter sp.]|nr:cell wall hydrolase [Caulobacter sp.]
TGVAPGWGPRMLRVAQVGLHVFYRFGGRGRTGVFGGQPNPSGVDDLPDAPTFASLAPMTPGADGKTAGVFYVANAMATAVGDATAPQGALQGMGGPAGPAVEPASAPPEAKPAAADVAKATKISADKPAEATKAVKISVDKAELRPSATTATGAAS